ncbi:MAG TPA: DeoR/GlpR family DNA-binding transcription regulator [Chitinophagaceae bacterium]|nr:DeoR/GlpR family DNA-binding transcription regulator [Chitinophagaceae bacterium]
MLKQERHAYILHQVNLHNKVLSSTLSDEINVSEDTIRRDLQELADIGKLIKVHGGAISHSFYGNSFVSQPNVYSLANKITIAKKAVSVIKDGMFVLTGGGTTIIEMARLLPASLKATFITTSIQAALEYTNHPNIEVIIAGDKISKSSKITVGVESIERLKKIKADLCIMGVNAIDVQYGVSDNDWDVVQTKKAMIESSQKVVCLTIAEKINTIQPIHVCGINKINMLVTEFPANDPKLSEYVNAGVEIM